jgi:hypothetical protein
MNNSISEPKFSSNVHLKKAVRAMQSGAHPSVIARHLARVKCILCGVRGCSALGAFIPTGPSTIPPGRARLYGACRRHDLAGPVTNALIRDRLSAERGAA